MTETTVTYHREYGGTARPAINVKMHAAGADFWPDAFRGLPEGHRGGALTPDAWVEAAYQRVTSDFWQAAEEIADQLGMGEIAQEGRSGGWLVFTDGRDPEDLDTFAHMTEDNGHGRCPVCDSAVRGGGSLPLLHAVPRERRDVADWLAGYRAMSEWAREYTAAAPARIRSLAQGMAMDEIGEAGIAVRALIPAPVMTVPAIGAESARRMFAFLAPYPGESYAEVAARPDVWCPSSPDGMGSHVPDGGACAECGQEVSR